MLETTLSNHRSLREKPSREASMRIRTVIKLTLRRKLLRHPIQLSPNLHPLLTLLPRLRPINLTMMSRCRPNLLQHPLCRINVWWTRYPRSLCKIPREGAGIGTDVTEEDGFAAGGEEKYAVEGLEEDGGRLMDSAENGLAVHGELSEEGADGPSGLGVKARGGLIQKQKQLGFCGEFDTDSETFALLHIQT